MNLRPPGVLALAFVTGCGAVSLQPPPAGHEIALAISEYDDLGRVPARILGLDMLYRYRPATMPGRHLEFGVGALLGDRSAYDPTRLAETKYETGGYELLFGCGWCVPLADVEDRGRTMRVGHTGSIGLLVSQLRVEAASAAGTASDKDTGIGLYGRYGIIMWTPGERFRIEVGLSSAMSSVRVFGDNLGSYAKAYFMLGLSL